MGKKPWQWKQDWYHNTPCIRTPKLWGGTPLVVAAKFLLPFGKKDNKPPSPKSHPTQTPFGPFSWRRKGALLFHGVTKHVFLSIAQKRAETCLHHMLLLPQQGHSHKQGLGAPPIVPQCPLSSKQQLGLKCGHRPLGERPSACHSDLIQFSESHTWFCYHVPV